MPITTQYRGFQIVQQTNLRYKVAGSIRLFSTYELAKQFIDSIKDGVKIKSTNEKGNRINFSGYSPF